MKQEPFTLEQTWLECIQCGYVTDLLKETSFRCPKCKSLYDVKHKIGNNIPGGKNPIEYYFYDVFDKRLRENPYGSGVWRFKEWIMPHLPDKYIVSLNEGRHNIYKAGPQLREWLNITHRPIDVRIMMEGENPSGSFKDNGGTVMISIAVAAGKELVACSSTGDTSAMLGIFAAKAGLKSIVLLPDGKITPAQLGQPLAYGSKVILLPGNFDDCMEVMQELVAKYQVYPGNSLNPTRIEGHQATVFLIAQHFNWHLPEWISVPVGNGSNSSSIGKALRLMKSLHYEELGAPFKTSRILACQSEAAKPLANSWKKIPEKVKKDPEKYNETWKKIFDIESKKIGETAATAALIGNPVSKDKVIREIIASNGRMEIAQEDDLNQATMICNHDGISVCPQTGIALDGVRQAIENGHIKDGERVVVVSTATGLKFINAITQSSQDAIKKATTCKTNDIYNMF